jgi:GTP diphosphokinase / guanosine-3',5'-bis(diphosphate) 3'-diphosphatase
LHGTCYDNYVFMQEIDQEQEKREILNRYRDLLKVCKPRTSSQDKQIIRKAFNLALEAHKDMRRKSGEPYIYHPIEVAIIAAGEIGLGTTSIVCSLLHDVVEDTDYTVEDIRGLFGEKVARIIDGLTKISGLFDQKTESLQAENFRKMLLTLSEDVRVILIKLADRLHNMRTLESLPAEKQLKIASETRYMYAPLAHRLGLYPIKSELEDLAFKFMEPDIYDTITEKIKESEPERKRFITKFTFPIKKALAEQEIQHTILTRTKSVFSIWEKMRKKEIPFEEVYDLFAIRLIIDAPMDQEKIACWKVYAIVTDLYRPNQDRLRDWISIPKANGYEALHTTVMSNTGRWVEVQIRSTRMDEIAEKGYAAHWKYKDVNSQESALDEWLAKIRELLQSPESNALDFLDDFKLNLFADEIFLFTPKGDLVTLPLGSTALDFAYSIHSHIGNSCIAAKVNHKLVPLSHKLKSGDQVEIINSEKQTPKEEWFNFVITARAKTQIKEFIKEERKKLATKGKDMLKNYFNEIGLEFNTAHLNKFLHFSGFSTLNDLFCGVADEKIGVKDLKECLQAHEKEGFFKFIRIPFTRFLQSDTKQIQEPGTEESVQKAENQVLASEVKSIKYNLSVCCNPIPGDDVIGIIDTSGHIDIHRTNCKKATELMSRYGNKLVKPKWTPDEALEFLAGISIRGIDRVGLMNEITKVISKQMNINMHAVNLLSNDGLFEGTMMLYIHNTEQLLTLISGLKKINGIERVMRIN